uniref:Pyrroline-5-carboxylate reductase n=1 Tax=Panagrellus redivivus TaxID=6233 RepID=A0A7E4VZ40_PANRE
MSTTSALETLGAVSNRKLLVFGGGKMATAIVDGVVKIGLFVADNIYVSTRSEASAAPWRARGYKNAFTSNSALLDAATADSDGFTVILLAVKPQLRATLYAQLAEAAAFGRLAASKSMVISVLAAISTATLKQEFQNLKYTGPIVRIMPNTPCAIGSGTSLICADPSTDALYVNAAKDIFTAVGSVYEVPESGFDAASAISGCGPAFLFTVIEALADGGVYAGLPRDLATNLAADMVRGSGALVTASAQAPGKLKGDVCSPAGTTIAGVRELEKAGIRSAFIEAVLASTNRAKELR